MRYFFILGSNPAVSAAEILSLVQGEALTVSEIHKQAMVIECQKELNTKNLINKLGGTVKIGRLTELYLPIDRNALANFMASTLAQTEESGKIKFGYSVYALEGPKPAAVAAKAWGKLRTAGMETKRILKESGRSVRWVRPKSGSALTSVVVDKDGLVKQQSEFVVLVKNNNIYIGVTDAVQPFEQFSEVDYGRPERDTYRGMLPPKLARIMLNIAGMRPGKVVWDAFCGSGTVVTEALRLGVLEVYGSDLSDAAVADTNKNVEWLKNKGLAGRGCTTIFQNDSRQRPKKIPDGALDAVVSEPFLGKPQRGSESKKYLAKSLEELTKLYKASLTAWLPLLKDDGVVVLALPLYIVGLNRLGIDVEKITDGKYEAESLIPNMLTDRMGLNETRNHGVTYGRPDQRVWREIIRLRKK